MKLQRRSWLTLEPFKEFLISSLSKLLLYFMILSMEVANSSCHLGSISCTQEGCY